jgi:hypothetical protein
VLTWAISHIPHRSSNLSNNFAKNYPKETKEDEEKEENINHPHSFCISFPCVYILIIKKNHWQFEVTILYIMLKYVPRFSASVSKSFR